MIRLIALYIILTLMSLVAHSQDVYHYIDGNEVHLRWKGKPDSKVEGYTIYQKKGDGWQKIAETKRIIKNRKIKEVVGAYSALYLQLAGVESENGDFTEDVYQKLLSNAEAYNFFGANTILHPNMAKALGEYAQFEKTDGNMDLEIRTIINGEESMFKAYLIDGKEKAQLSALLMPEARADGDKVLLSWVDSKKQNASILGVRVYRSLSILGPFVQINPSGLGQFITSENQESNQKYVDNYLNPGTYYYYITQFNMFGFESEPSPIRSVKISAAQSVYFTDFRAEKKLGMIKLKWESSVDNTPVLIYRQVQGESVSDLLYPPSKSIDFVENQYFDRTAKPGVTYNYYLMSGSTSSDTIRFSLVDTRKPLPPTEVDGTVSKNGLVRIEWTASESDNILGYVIERYSGDSGTNAFALTSTPIKNTFYEDQLDVKSESAYRYAIKAVNQNYIESDATDLIRLRRPDDIPPKIPVITYIKLTDSIVNLRWTPALEQDFYHYVVYKSSTDGEIVRYRTTVEQEWKDTVRSSGTFNYAVSAMDADNNESAIGETFGISYTQEFDLDPPTDVTVIDTSGGILVKWQPSLSQSVVGYMIERQMDGDEFPQLIKEVKDGATSYIDTHSSPSKTTRYFIYAHDSRWNVSKVVEIKYKGKK